jgi:hypothetical protein
MTLKKLSIFPLLLLFFSCKKDTNTTPPQDLYYLTAFINGVESNFNIDLHASPAKSISGGITRCSILGLQYLPGDTTGLALDLHTYIVIDELKPGVYPTSTFDLLVVHQKSSTDQYYANDPYYVRKFNLTIEEITNVYMLGSFSGTIINNKNSSDTLKITDGKFKVRL